MYGVKKIDGIQGGYRGFYACNTVPLTPKSVNDIHERGGAILGTSRGGHDAIKIVGNIQDRGINQIYIIGGDGTQKGAAVTFEDCSLIPESPVYLEGKGQELIADSIRSLGHEDASGNKLLLDVGLWLSQKIKILRAVRGAMAGYTGFTVGIVNGRHTYLPFYRVTEKTKQGHHN
ncbi:hypothetical protein OPV22_019152 [Ensete ventricosum]|uniref:Phosphofructokinase domain-containing protein n=1 Tax=Ensete ventricosum TaxID=4639 RepID=A0AAV8R1W4_ENSVE|nr:hypothetical protein OPV22_019152 [Ensete ventricosum]